MDHACRIGISTHPRALGRCSGLEGRRSCGDSADWGIACHLCQRMSPALRGQRSSTAGTLTTAVLRVVALVRALRAMAVPPAGKIIPSISYFSFKTMVHQSGRNAISSYVRAVLAVRRCSGYTPERLRFLFMNCFVGSCYHRARTSFEGSRYSASACLRKPTGENRLRRPTCARKSAEATPCVS